MKFLFQFIFSFCLLFTGTNLLGQSNHTHEKTHLSYHLLKSSTISIVKAIDFNTVNSDKYIVKNHLYIEMNESVNYDKAELLEKSTGDLILTQKIIGSKASLDMTGVYEGLYTLVLTNVEGKIKVEDILVMSTGSKN